MGAFVGCDENIHDAHCAARGCEACHGAFVFCSRCTCAVASAFAAAGSTRDQSDGRCGWSNGTDVADTDSGEGGGAGSIPEGDREAATAELRAQLVSAWLKYQMTPDLTFSEPSFYRWLQRERRDLIEAGTTPEDVRLALRAVFASYGPRP